jgi:hypothetical protein
VHQRNGHRKTSPAGRILVDEFVNLKTWAESDGVPEGQGRSTCHGSLIRVHVSANNPMDFDRAARGLGESRAPSHAPFGRMSPREVTGCPRVHGIVHFGKHIAAVMNLERAVLGRRKHHAHGCEAMASFRGLAELAGA